MIEKIRERYRWFRRKFVDDLSYREQLLFGAYLAVVLILSPVVAAYSIQAWDLLYDNMSIRSMPTGEVGMFVFGLVSVWLFLLAHDIRKHLQALLISLLAGASVVVMTLGGELFADIPLTLNSLTWAVFGVLVALASEYVPKRDQISWEDYEPWHVVLDGEKDAEFNIARLGLLSLVSVLVVLMNVVLLTFGTGNVLLPMICSVVLLFGLFKFMEVDTGGDDTDDNEVDFQAIGPGESGKSLFILGLGLSALEKAKNNSGYQYEFSPHGKFNQMIQAKDDLPATLARVREEVRRLQEDEGKDPEDIELTQLADSDENIWVQESDRRDEFTDIGFTVEYGDLHSKKATISMMDHGGQLIHDLLDNVVNADESEEAEKNPVTDGGTEDDDSFAESSMDDDEDFEAVDDGDDFEILNDEDPYEVGEMADADRSDTDDSFGSSSSGDMGADRSNEPRDGSFDSDFSNDPMDVSSTEPSPDSTDDRDLETDSGTDTDSTTEDGTGRSWELDEEATGDEQADDFDDETRSLDEDDFIDDEELLGNQLEGANKIAVLLDCETNLKNKQQYQDDITVEVSYSGYEGLFATSYRDIVDHYDFEEVIMVATKADVYREEFEAEYEDEEWGWDDLEENDEAWNAFRDFVNDQFDKSGVSVLRGQESVQSRIKPVFYRTTTLLGERIPELDEHGDLQPVGFDRILDNIIR